MIPIFLKPSFGIQAAQAGLPFVSFFLPKEQPEQLVQEVHPAGQDGAAVGVRPAVSRLSSFENEVATRFIIPECSRNSILRHTSSNDVLSSAASISTERERPSLSKASNSSISIFCVRAWSSCEAGHWTERACAANERRKRLTVRELRNARQSATVADCNAPNPTKSKVRYDTRHTQEEAHKSCNKAR